MEKYVWIILIIIAGACLPIQAGYNAKIGKALESPLQASFVSFTVGALGLLAIIIFSRQTILISQISSVPKYAWSSGLFGAFYVLMVIIAFKKLGALLTFGLIVAGQMSMSLFLDHNKILVDIQHAINAYRLIGVGLIITGVVLIRNF